MDNEIILVETVSTFKHVYAIRVFKGKMEWALDSVVMNEVENEISQKHIGESVFSHRVVSEEELSEIFKEGNGYESSDISRFVYDLTGNGN